MAHHHVVSQGIYSRNLSPHASFCSILHIILPIIPFLLLLYPPPKCVDFKGLGVNLQALGYKIGELKDAGFTGNDYKDTG